MFLEMLALYGAAAVAGWAMNKIWGPDLEKDIYYEDGTIKLDCERYYG
jgi:hypothetical protein